MNEEAYRPRHIKYYICCPICGGGGGGGCTNLDQGVPTLAGGEGTYLGQGEGVPSTYLVWGGDRLKT